MDEKIKKIDNQNILRIWTEERKELLVKDVILQQRASLVENIAKLDELLAEFDK